MLVVHTIPCRINSMNNLAYLIVDKDTGQSAVIDPSEVNPIVNCCSQLNLKPDYIFNTHHHFDHTDGNLEIKKLYNCKIVANQNDADRIPGIDIGILPDNHFKLGNSDAVIIDVSAHTKNHILWYFPDDKILFTGDTLFNLCIGGLFEGTAQDMFQALNKIKSLPDDVCFYPGHEYTEHAIPMAQHFVPNRQDLDAYLSLAKQNLENYSSSAPIPLGLEKKCNPYLIPQSWKKFLHLF